MPAKGVTDRFSILVADDDDELREAVRESIAPRGYRTLGAACGKEAIEIVRLQMVHALIMDVNMPDIDGITAFEEIEQIVPYHLPCIFMSAHVTPEVQMRAMLARAYSVLPKPFALDMIRILVDEIVQKFYGVKDIG